MQETVKTEALILTDRYSTSQEMQQMPMNKRLR